MSLITSVLNPNKEYCIDNVERLSNAIGYIIRIYFGMNIQNVDADLIREVIKSITLKHKTLTFQEMNLAFTERTIEKRQGVSLTRDEIMRYIEDMVAKKHIVLSIHEQEEKKKAEQQKNEAEKVAFVNKSMEMYHDHLRNGITEWSGTDFEALPAAMEFAQSVTHEKKKLLTLDAQREYKERVCRNEQEGNAFEIIPPIKYIYARMMLNYLLNREIGAHPAIVE